MAFGEIPLVKTDWYNSLIWKRREAELKPPIYPNERVKGRPIVVSISTLERVVVCMNSLGVSFADLHGEKASLPPSSGDWDAFMSSKLSQIQDKKRKIPFLDEQNHDFFTCLGVSPEKIKMIQL